MYNVYGVEFLSGFDGFICLLFIKFGEIVYSFKVKVRYGIKSGVFR